MSRRIPLAVAAVTGLLLAVPLVPAAAAPGDIDVQLLAVNDFHGRIEVQSGGDGELITDPGPDGAYGTDDDIVELVGGAANLAITLNADGFGTQAQKLDKYDAFTRGQKKFANGYKLFYKEDTDLMTPAQVMRMRPRPDLVVYE